MRDAGEGLLLTSLGFSCRKMYSRPPPYVDSVALGLVCVFRSMSLSQNLMFLGSMRSGTQTLRQKGFQLLGPLRAHFASLVPTPPKRGGQYTRSRTASRKKEACE